MPVSRRGFLRLAGPAGPSPFSAAFLSARGLEVDEMKRAVAVFGEVLAKKATAA